MAADNDNRKNTGTDDASNENPESWIEKSLDKINTDFPLSGGETEDDLEKVKDPAEKPEHASWVEKAIEEINKDFPLSGAETEDDLK